MFISKKDYEFLVDDIHFYEKRINDAENLISQYKAVISNCEEQLMLYESERRQAEMRIAQLEDKCTELEGRNY